MCSITSNDEGVGACLVLSTHLFRWQAENREERDMGGSGWRMSWRGGAGEEIPSGWLLVSREFSKVHYDSTAAVQRDVSASVCLIGLEHICLWMSVCVFKLIGYWCTGYILACAYTVAGVCVCVCLSERHITSGGRWELWTTNEATDWQLFFVAKLAPIYPLFPLSHFKPLLALMDNMS